jgi:hypothetical protein
MDKCEYERVRVRSDVIDKEKNDEQHNSVYTRTMARAKEKKENINKNKFSRFEARNTRNSKPPIIISNQQ